MYLIIALINLNTFYLIELLLFLLEETHQNLDQLISFLVWFLTVHLMMALHTNLHTKI